MGLMYRKAKVKLTYLEEKPEVYKLRQLTYPAVTYDQLLGMIQIVGVNRAQTKAVVDALLQSLVHYMEIGHGVSLGTFGSFKPVFTSKTVKVKKVQFFPGGDFKDMLKALSMNSAGEAIDVKE